MSGMLATVKEFLPDWPEWALDVLLIMSALLLAAVVFSTMFAPPDDETTNDQNETIAEQQASKDLHDQFMGFRNRYILVYLVIMLADWMQGTHMYTLYLSYNVNISALFLTGFLSGAFFAPFLGSAVDKFGRKNSCIVYCVLEIVINTLEHSTDFGILLLGRVLGGISTNLLFSAFESWMTTEHRKRGFPEEWLSRTYSAASIGNGTMAILAGVVSQVLEDQFGHIGPFQGAIALTILALVLVLAWEENYGETKDDEDKKEGGNALSDQFFEGWTVTLSNSSVWKIGLIQAFSEGAMYTFVFMWVPTLLSMNPPGGLPTGCVFSAMMMAITIGGMIFPILQSIFSTVLGSKRSASEACASFIYFAAAASMAVPAYFLSGSAVEEHFHSIIMSFMLVECCVGLFMPVAGTLRSKYVPDALQGAILNIFRLPLNAVVVSGTYATDVLEPSVLFTAVSLCFFGAGALQLTMMGSTASKKKTD